MAGFGYTRRGSGGAFRGLLPDGQLGARCTVRWNPLGWLVSLWEGVEWKDDSHMYFISIQTSKPLCAFSVAWNMLAHRSLLREVGPNLFVGSRSGQLRTNIFSTAPSSGVNASASPSITP